MATITELDPQAQEWIKEWIIGLTESGTMEDVLAAFARELLPYARAAARRAQHKHLGVDANVAILKLRPYLVNLVDSLTEIASNPGLMSEGSEQEWRRLTTAMVELRNWIDFLDSIELQEAIVHPSAEVLMQKGGSP
jgi:hypothetical protein